MLAQAPSPELNHKQNLPSSKTLLKNEEEKPSIEFDEVLLQFQPKLKKRAVFMLLLPMPPLTLLPLLTSHQMNTARIW
jgi:hypothetical protein